MADNSPGSPGTTGAGQRRKVEVDDLYRYRLISDPQVSPNGGTVAYVQIRLRKKQNDYASNIWLAPTDGSREPYRFTGSDKRDMSPRWAPSGEELAFVSTRSGKPQLWVISTGGGEARQLTRWKHGVGEFVWSPDGKWIVFAASVDNEDDKRRAAEAKSKGPGAATDEASGSGGESANSGLEPGSGTEEGLPGAPTPAGEWDEDSEDEAAPDDKGDRAHIITRLHFKADGAGLLERRQHLFIVPSSGGKPAQLTEGDWDAGTPRWAPDGTQLAFLANKEPDAEHNAVVDIFLTPIDEEGKPGEQRRVTDHDSAISTLEWLPDGTGFAVFAHSRINEGALATNLQVWAVSLEGQINKLTEGFDRSGGNWVNSDLRSGAGEVRLHFGPDGSLIYFLVTNGGAAQIYSVPVGGGEVKQIIGGDRQIFNFGVGKRSVVFAATTPTLPNDLFCTDLDGSNERRITDINRDITGQLALSEPQLFEIETAPGVRVEGWLMLPYGYEPGKKYPLVLQIHGGPHTAYGDSYFHEFQVMCARGYIVLYTNPRGSQGYGQSFSDAILNDWGGVDDDDLMACLDYALAQGNVDENRLGVAGGSYGGYMVTWIIGHTQRFRAAVASRMVSNLYSAWGSGDFTWMLWNWEFQGPPQERMALYMERSPITYVNDMHTPLLITHASDDLRTQIEQADQMYTALKVLKREVEMVRFPSGGHDVSRSGKPSLRVERIQRIADWFDKHLGE